VKTGGRVRRMGQHDAITRRADDCATRVSMAPALADAETRIITLSGGVAWLITVVARLASEDAVVGTETVRLVLRMECLTPPHRTVRVATVRARSLRSVDVRRLRRLVSVPAVRSRSRYSMVGSQGL